MLNRDQWITGDSHLPGHHLWISAKATVTICVALTGLIFWFLFFGNTAGNLVAQGQAAFDRKEYSRAMNYAEQAIAVSPKLASAWKLLAQSACQSGQNDRSLTGLEEYARRRPADAGKLSIRLGTIWMRRNFVRPALRALQLAEHLSVDVQTSLKTQEQIVALTGHTRETTRCIVELLKRDSFGRSDLMLISAPVPRRMDQSRLDAILHAEPTNLSPLLAKALDELHLNRIEAAERLLLTITASQPEDIEAQATLAEVHAESFPEKFLRWHAQLPIQAVDDARVWSARGKWLSSIGKTESAIRCLHEALLREPEQLPATVLIGQLLKSIGLSDLGNDFTERGRRMQRIFDLNARLNDLNSNEPIILMIDELEATGRLWEAWGWCEVYKANATSQNTLITDCQERLKPQLNFRLPRTKPGSLPGRDFRWEQFPLPDWSRLEFPDHKSPKMNSNGNATIRFEDQAERLGLDFRYINSYSSAEGRKIFESMGAGVGVIDFDGDCWPDLYFPQGSRSPAGMPNGPSDALYRNLNGERFIRVTQFAGIHETSYSQGVAVGDYDNDGFPDIYVANFGRNCLYRNQGDGTFADVTEQAGLKQSVWTVSCAIADLNGNGMPELFDVNYVQGQDLLTRTCPGANQRPRVCRPTVFDPVLDTVSENMGDGRFVEKQAEARLDLPLGMGLGLIIADFNDDGQLDLFVANDMSANYLLINEQTSSDRLLRFHDEAILRNVAFDEHGLAKASMGVGCADINRDGKPDLLVTNFTKESSTLYLSQPGGFYRDATRFAGLHDPSFNQLGFGTQFLDADRDGWFDLVVVNGHLDRFEGEPFQMKAQIFRGQSDGRFTELFAKEAGVLFDVPRLGRGLALLDFNRDGRTDFVATDLEGPVLLGTNQTDSPYRSIRLKLVGTNSSRDAIGAKVKFTIAQGDERVYQLTAGDGYEASNERVIEICLGNVERIRRLEIRWPSGMVSTRDDIEASGDWLVIEAREDWIRRGDR